MRLHLRFSDEGEIIVNPPLVDPAALAGVGAFLDLMADALEDAADGGELVLRPSIGEAQAMLHACAAYLNAADRAVARARPSARA